MLLFKKIIFIVSFLVSACGFSPIYTDQNSAKITRQISIQEPSTQDEFIFYSQLINRFNENGNKYILSYAISTSKEDRALNLDGIIHRVEIAGSVIFSLKDSESGREILSDKEKVYLSYSNLGSTAAVLNAERTTNKELVVLLANKVADRISLIVVEDGS